MIAINDDIGMLYHIRVDTPGTAGVTRFKLSISEEPGADDYSWRAQGFHSNQYLFADHFFIM